MRFTCYINFKTIQCMTSVICQIEHRDFCVLVVSKISNKFLGIILIARQTFHLTAKNLFIQFEHYLTSTNKYSEFKSLITKDNVKNTKFCT